MMWIRLNTKRSKKTMMTCSFFISASSLDDQDRLPSPFSLVNIRNAIDGRLEASRTTKWILSNAPPTHSLTILSSSSSVTLLVSTTLYSTMSSPSPRSPFGAQSQETHPWFSWLFNAPLQRRIILKTKPTIRAPLTRIIMDEPKKAIKKSTG